jgi:transcriptional regulator with XRE-family HTH domain
MFTLGLTCQQNYTKINNIRRYSTTKGGKILNYKLKGAIYSSGKTMGTFADELGVSRGGFWKKISGQSEFTESEIQKACEILNAQPTDIFFGIVSTKVSEEQGEPEEHSISQGVEA